VPCRSLAPQWKSRSRPKGTIQPEKKACTMRRRQSFPTQFFWTAVRVAVRLSDWARRSAPLTLLTGIAFAAGALWLTSAASQNMRIRRAWGHFLGHPALSQAEPLASGGISGYTLTTFDVSGAGSGVIEGTFAIAMDAFGDVTGAYLDSNRTAHGFIRASS